VIIFEEGDFWHLPFEICPIFEEVAFMVLVKLVPDFLAAVDHLLIIFLADHCLILGQLSDSFLLHFFCEFVEDDMLFRSSILIEFYLTPDLLFRRIFLHC
jgi:hypothetical protein